MASCTTAASTSSTSVGMGQIQTANDSGRLTAVLGSCIAIVLYHPRVRVAVMAHVVLPASANRSGPPGKYADTALPHMIQLIERAGAPRAGVIAKMAGGASMFGGDGPLQIGQANGTAVAEELRKLNIRLTGQNVGGQGGRRVTFQAADGTFLIEKAGSPAVTL